MKNATTTSVVTDLSPNRRYMELLAEIKAQLAKHNYSLYSSTELN
ncbi:MAG: hypothetical protein DID90_2727554857 [Candidatus Nitrotoga sp. LAW]|nr:MAG: hypothetical protein DID90_2727554857 [Candidatus Nitrotoga sp. LAW]